MVVAAVSPALGGLFMVVEMMRHRDHLSDRPAAAQGAHGADHAVGRPAMTVALAALPLAVIGMAETLAPARPGRVWA
ncbi:MAG: hypothetical protein EA355_01385 [Rhodobacteraceae bacterium]|nr:MAG: hypothetical protein EA355_01385 [Paracoccaceae bacterium]